MTDAVSTAPETLRDRTPVAVTVDNIIRRRLRIGDPSNPRDVADGLRRVFAGEARGLDLEASGLPLLPAAIYTPAPAPAAAGPSSTELDQATGDIDRDLVALINDAQLKDIEPELQGWSQAIRGLVAEGIAAARIALDPRSRDRAMGARRQLGDYARLARFVGALTCTENSGYRRLAQSLDEIAALILVLIGEALARIGFGGGRFLLQAPASELQGRRDAVILALRNLNGVTQGAFGSDFPYGLDGLRKVLALLDRSGHSDLRALFDENTIGRMMDELLDRAATANAAGLRALGATAAVAVQRLVRLLQIVDNHVTPLSPQLISFLEAIRLFVDGFETNTGGYRLLFVARPPAVFYGLYGISGPDAPTQRLLNLVLLRGRLAALLDCYGTGSCCENPALCQAMLDKLLYDTDRAIDLYALGSDTTGNGEPEWRAAAYGLLINSFLKLNSLAVPAVAPPPGTLVLNCLDGDCLPTISSPDSGLRATLVSIRDTVLNTGTLPPLPKAMPASTTNAQRVIALGVMADELCMQRRTEQHWGNLLGAMAPSCIDADHARIVITGLLDDALGSIKAEPCTDIEPPIPPTPAESADALNHFLKGKP